MTLYPPAAAVTVLLDGRPVSAYNRAFASSGRVFAPLRPYVTGVADRVWFEGDTLLIERDDRVVRVRMLSRAPDALDRAYVPLAAVLRALGLIVGYEERSRTVEIRVPTAATVMTPTPFNTSVPAVVPRVVFTPIPTATPRPIWTGSPLPRRTPLPFTEPTSSPSP